VAHQASLELYRAWLGCDRTYAVLAESWWYLMEPSVIPNAVLHPIKTGYQTTYRALGRRYNVFYRFGVITTSKQRCFYVIYCLG